MTATANKTDAGNGSNGICRVIDASRSPSPDPGRSAPLSPMPQQSIIVDRSFPSVEALWEALLLRSSQRALCPFAEHEDAWIESLRLGFPADSEGTLWEVLQISRSIDSFMVNLAASEFTPATIDLMRSLLVATRPDDSVYVCIFDPVIPGDTVHIGSIALFRDEVWGTQSLYSRGLTAPKAEQERGWQASGLSTFCDDSP